MDIKVAVIGVGYLGRHHARIYSEIEGVQLVGVVDIDKHKTVEIAEKYHCQAFTDYHDILSQVDALSIVTPTTTHFEIAIGCLKAGKDILVEKPFTVTLEEAEVLIQEANRRGSIIQVGLLERFNPAVLTVNEMIKKPRFFESERLSPFLDRSTDVDVTLDLMIHDIDIILSLCHSSVSDIRGVGARVLTDKLDVAKVWVEMDNGVKALLTASRLAAEKRRVLKVFQDSEYIILDYQNFEIVRYFKDSSGKIVKETVNSAYREPLKEELKEFIFCLRGRSQPRVTGHDGKEALKVVLEINKRIKEAI